MWLGFSTGLTQACLFQGPRNTYQDEPLYCSSILSWILWTMMGYQWAQAPMQNFILPLAVLTPSQMTRRTPRGGWGSSYMGFSSICKIVKRLHHKTPARRSHFRETHSLRRLQRECVILCPDSIVSFSLSCWHYILKPVLQEWCQCCSQEVILEEVGKKKKQTRYGSPARESKQVLSPNKHVLLINTYLPSFLKQLRRVTWILSLWIILEEIAFLSPNDLRTKQVPHFMKSNYPEELVQRGA